MPRAVKDARLDSAAARQRLEVRKKPHYRLIEPGLHVGYYRGERGGSWIGRRYVQGGKYATRQLGLADDGREANGRDVLTFAQAQAAARQWATLRGRENVVSGADGPPVAPPTVGDALDSYLVAYQARGGKAHRDTQTAIEAHIRPKLGKHQISALTAAMINAWHRGLATAAPRLRTKATATNRKVRTVPADDKDGQRARRATANRVLTILKAALNMAYRDGVAASDDAWRRVQAFRQADAAAVRYLTDGESKALVEACEPALRTLVTAAILTGCRYGELTTLRTRDVDINNMVLTLPTSKSGSVRHVVLTDEALAFFRPLTQFKARDDLLLTRNGAQWTKSAQARPMRDACYAAGIRPAVSFHILRHTHASRLAVAGVPMAVIAAQLGHADLKMTIKHYAHLSPGYVSATIRAAFGSMGLL